MELARERRCYQRTSNGKGGDAYSGSAAYDGKVGAGPYGEIKESVVLWSKGKDKSDATDDQRDDVRSWH